MSDREDAIIAEDWKVFASTKGYQWLIKELDEKIINAENAELAADPLDFCFRPWRYACLKARRQGAQDLKEEILRHLKHD